MKIHSEEKKKRLIELARMLGACFESQKTYGQDASKIESLIGIFDLTLADYDIKLIREAFLNHLQNKTDFPTPACIMGILRPNKEITNSAYINAVKWLETHKDAPFTLEEQKFSKIKKEYEASQVQIADDKQEWETLQGDKAKALLGGVKRLS